MFVVRSFVHSFIHLKLPMLTKCDGLTDWLTKCNSSGTNLNWDQLSKLTAVFHRLLIYYQYPLVVRQLTLLTFC